MVACPVRGAPAETLGSGTNRDHVLHLARLLLARLTYKAESQGKYALSRGEIHHAHVQLVRSAEQA